MSAGTTTVGLAEIEAARTLLEGVAIRTPMEESRWLSSVVGVVGWYSKPT